MKLLFTSLLLFASPFFIYSQKDIEKGSARKAEVLLSQNKVYEAKEEIEKVLNWELEKVSKQEKKEVKARTLFIHAKIYHSIGTKEKPTSQTKDNIRKAVNSYREVAQKDEKLFSTFSVQRLELLFNQLYNSGVQSFQIKELRDAIIWFEAADLVMPNNITILTNLLYCSYYQKEDKKAEEYIVKLIELGYQKSYLYRILTKNAIKNEDFNNALKFVNKGLELNPQAKNLKILKANIYILKSDHINAVPVLKEIIATDSSDLEAHYNLALTYTQLKQGESAISTYNKIIEKDSSFVGAYRGIGAIYYNQAQRISHQLDSVENLPRKQLNASKEQKKLRKSLEETLNRAIPFFEKSFSLDSSCKDCLLILLKAYQLTGQKKDFTRVKNLLENHFQ